jgi:5-(carboxyamino)imidazole ribonucleotide synthase
VTWEFENLPLELVDTIANKTAIYPAVSLLEIKRDRLTEKQHFTQLQLPVVPFYPVNCISDIVSFPVILKQRFNGYDGKGQYRLMSPKDWPFECPDAPQPNTLIAESLIEFNTEISIIGTRDQHGNTQIYDIACNHHHNGILHTSTIDTNSPFLSQATQYLMTLFDSHDYVGTMAVEFFVCNHQLIINECAPRVHNTGHWTIEGSATSQFENHIRAITGQELGCTHTHFFPGMINMIGHTLPSPYTSHQNAVFIHNYQKAPKPGRKLGHITILGNSVTHRDQLMTKYQKSAFVL